MPNIQVSQINPRVTLITEKMEGLQSIAMGFFIAAGSRNENENEQGLTHLTEHMIFKGTKNKSAQDISRLFESLGAMIDAFTSKEVCGIYFNCLSPNLERIFNLFFEMIQEASFDEQELEKEKNVILQEITESYENPQEYLHQLFSQIMFPGHPLAFPIAGTPEILKSFTREDLVRCHQNYSLNKRLCITIAGNVNHDELLNKLLKMGFKYTNQDYLVLPTPPAQHIERALIFETRPDLKQIHTIAGFLTIPLKDERRNAITVLNNIFGGLQSSRLVQRLREQDGLVSTVFTFLDFYSDVGIFAGYHISEIKNREKSLMTAFEELRKFKQCGITKQEFERSVNYCKGMLALASEDPMSRTILNTKNFLLLNRVISIEESIAEFDNLTFNNVNSLTELFKAEEYSAAIVGPIKKEDLGKIGVAPIKVIEK